VKFTFNWLKDYVEIKIPAQSLAEKLTMAGLEVTSLEEKDGDFVFEIEVTSNRPDWLSVIGIAREVAAITGKKIKAGTRHKTPFGSAQGRQDTSKGKKFPEHKLRIEIESKKDCPWYTAKIIRDVKVGPSPDWLKKRLELVGCRSINNVVDITNYILFTYGEPLHAFDLDALKGDTIIVRRAKDKEKITTIDGDEKQLNGDILVIADQNHPVAVAGVMGGKLSEVTEKTSNILLEAAVFDPVLIRRGRRALGLQSESSYRFERGVDLGMVELSSHVAIDLMQQTCGGQCVLAKSSSPPKEKPKTITLDTSDSKRILGLDITTAKIKSLLSRLGFLVKTKNKKCLSVSIPSYRPDVSLAIDLMEEIARIYGYENIPTTVPVVKPTIPEFQERDAVLLIKNILTGLGLQEVITYSLIDRRMLEGFSRAEEEAIVIANPLSSEQEILRPTLLPSLAGTVAYNLQQKQPYISIFEIAKTYTGSGKEGYSLGLAFCGERTLWFGPQYPHINDQVGFLHLKGVLEILCQRLGLQSKPEVCHFTPAQNPDEYIVQVQNKTMAVGILKRLPRDILDRLEIKHREVFLAEVDLEKVIPHIRRVRPIHAPARYPGITRDISLSLPQGISFASIQQEILNHGGKLLQEVSMTDYYTGEPIPPGHKGLTVSCLYSSAERTLTDAEVNTLHAQMVKALQENLQATIR
jgi:phenylalanyl-tRNA synthetase beta chain